MIKKYKHLIIILSCLLVGIIGYFYYQATNTKREYKPVYEIWFENNNKTYHFSHMKLYYYDDYRMHTVGLVSIEKDSDIKDILGTKKFYNIKGTLSVKSKHSIKIKEAYILDENAGNKKIVEFKKDNSIELSKGKKILVVNINFKDDDRNNVLFAAKLNVQ